ncbi:hypothetical protein M0R45_030690 [Rubus argutus]|uniref:Uncharacterized protein n=1 Tax=Rubus argutus TaxID=59490 RepID=A0AAW1WG37_RUBAR
MAAFFLKSIEPLFTIIIHHGALQPSIPQVSIAAIFNSSIPNLSWHPTPATMATQISRIATNPPASSQAINHSSCNINHNSNTNPTSPFTTVAPSHRYRQAQKSQLLRWSLSLNRTSF